MNVLKTAIEKALSNGWDMFGLGKSVAPIRSWSTSEPPGSVLFVYFEQPSGGGTIGPWTYSLEQIIFDIDFAKALFGENCIKYKYCNECVHLKERFDTGDCLEDWGHHLQQLATSTDRLAYLEKWLNDNG